MLSICFKRNFMKLLLECSLLILPALIYALWNGRNGISHPAYKQVFTVAFIMLFCVSIVRLLALYFETIPFAKTVPELLWWYLKALLVSITGYGLLFPPLMNYVLSRKNPVFKSLSFKAKLIDCLDHLSPTAFPDKLFIKFKVHYLVRLIGYFLLFVASLIWFVW